MKVILTYFKNGRKCITSFLCSRFYSVYSEIYCVDYLVFEEINYTKNEKRIVVPSICKIEVKNAL